MVDGKPKAETKKLWKSMTQGVTELSALFKRKEQDAGEYKKISEKQKVDITLLENELQRVKEELHILKRDPTRCEVLNVKKHEDDCGHEQLPDMRLRSQHEAGLWMWFQTVMFEGILKDQADVFSYIPFDSKQKSSMDAINQELTGVLKKRTDLFSAACNKEGLPFTPIESVYKTQLVTLDIF
jgi:phosphoribosylformylglycinamidine (FGAM) synthase-like enzyme